MTNRHYAIITEMITLLAQKFPAAIHVFERRRRPLAIGTFEAILAALPETTDSKVLKAALRTYCGNVCYLRSCAARNAVRVDLDGEPVGPVSKEDASFAAGAGKQAARTAAAKAAAKAAKAVAAVPGSQAARKPSIAPTAPPPAAAPSSATRDVAHPESGDSIRRPTSLSGLREAARRRALG